MKTVDEIFGEMLVCFGERTGMEVDPVSYTHLRAHET